MRWAWTWAWVIICIAKQHIIWVSYFSGPTINFLSHENIQLNERAPLSIHSQGLSPRTTFFPLHQMLRTRKECYWCAYPASLAVDILNLPKVWKGSMLNLVSPNLNSTGCQVVVGFVKKRCCWHLQLMQRDSCSKQKKKKEKKKRKKKNEKQKVFLPKCDLGKIILLHDLFILFLPSIKHSDL